MVDIVRLRALLSQLRSQRGKLTRYAQMDIEEYLSDEEHIGASRYWLITAVDEALAVANHVIASEGLRAPSDYADAFRSLRDGGVLTESLTLRLEDMTRFRNLLVQAYAKVDDRRLHGYLQQDVSDLDEFLKAVLDAFPGLEG